MLGRPIRRAVGKAALLLSPKNRDSQLTLVPRLRVAKSCDGAPDGIRALLDRQGPTRMALCGVSPNYWQLLRARRELLVLTWQVYN